MNEAPIIGIDLGTTYSRAAVIKNGRMQIIPIDGQNTIASCVSFGRNFPLIGNEVLENFIQSPKNTILDVKRLIGCRYADKEVQAEIKNCLYEIINENEMPKIEVNFRGENLAFTPEEICAMLLKYIKENAEKHLSNKTVCKAVITVPAQCKETQRQATKDAGRIAGFEIIKIIDEPTAAVMAYGFHKKFENDSDPRNILVYHFGADNFDVSVITIDDGVLDVKTTNSDTNLGGNDITDSLMKYFTHIYEQYHPGVNLRGNFRALKRLQIQCEQIKKKLSDKYSAELDIDNLIEDIDICKTISRSKFESLIRDKIEKTLTYVDKTLKEVNLYKYQIDEVILVGGSTRIPLVKNMVKAFFNGKNLKFSLNPDETVAIGAAVQASILDQADDEIIGTLLLLDVTALPFGIETAGGAFTSYIPRNTQIPVRVTKRFINEKDNQTKIKVKELKKTEANKIITKNFSHCKIKNMINIVF